MRCVCCDAVLSDFDATRKHGVTGQYLDTCSRCLDEINQTLNQEGAYMQTIDRKDLTDKDTYIEEEFELDQSEGLTDSDNMW
jgi:uncharacterized metal-binding protein YceD (DUF177 family)